LGLHFEISANRQQAKPIFGQRIAQVQTNAMRGTLLRKHAETTAINGRQAGLNQVVWYLMTVQYF
jgi:hypothetical protein